MVFPSSAVAATSQPASESGETLKSEGNEAVSESLDQTGHAQEVDVTVAARDSSSPAPSTVTGAKPTESRYQLALKSLFVNY